MKLVPVAVTLIAAALRRMSGRNIERLALFLAHGRLALDGRSNRQITANLTKFFGATPRPFVPVWSRQVYFWQIYQMFLTLRLGCRAARREDGPGVRELAATLQDLEACGKPGGVIVTAHLGGWDRVGHAVARATGQAMLAVAKRSRSPGLDLATERMRQHLGMETVWNTSSLGVMRRLGRALEDGRWVGFVMDQKPEGRRGPEVNFLGHITPFVAGPARIAQRRGCPVVAVFCLGAEACYGQIVHRVLWTPQQGELSELALVQRMAGEIDTWVRRYPEQWCWDYKRWSELPVSASGCERGQDGASR